MLTCVKPVFFLQYVAFDALQECRVYPFNARIILVQDASFGQIKSCAVGVVIGATCQIELAWSPKMISPHRRASWVSLPISTASCSAVLILYGEKWYVLVFGLLNNLRSLAVDIVKWHFVNRKIGAK